MATSHGPNKPAIQYVTKHPYASYWDRGVNSVPQMTGVVGLMDCPDIREVCEALGIHLPVGRLLDVGCGTGRVSQLCQTYYGVDIAQSAVDYCRQRRLQASLISGPRDAFFSNTGEWDWIWALSVFTHIGREERQQYLAAFAQLAPRLLVDILPGDINTGPPRWGADEQEFAMDLDAAGYAMPSIAFDREDPNCGAVHRYYDVGLKA